MKEKFAVIGLGTFGHNIARHLALQGAEVLAIDTDAVSVEDIKDHVDHAVIADATDPQCIMDLELQSFRTVIVAIGNRFEAVVLVVALLKQAGVPQIIARASQVLHRKILTVVGATKVICPEEEAGARIAKTLMLEGSTNIYDLGGGFVSVEAEPPGFCKDRHLGELRLRDDHSVNLVTILRSTGMAADGTVQRAPIGVPTSETRIEPGDILLIFGKADDIEAFLTRESD